MDSVSARFLGREKDKRRWYWTQRFCISSDLRYIEILRRRALGPPAAESEAKVCEMAFAAIILRMLSVMGSSHSYLLL